MRRRRRQIDWNRACEEAARRHRRKNDIRIIAFMTVLTVVAIIVYYIYFDPV